MFVIVRRRRRKKPPRTDSREKLKSVRRRVYISVEHAHPVKRSSKEALQTQITQTVPSGVCKKKWKKKGKKQKPKKREKPKNTTPRKPVRNRLSEKRGCSTLAEITRPRDTDGCVCARVVTSLLVPLLITNGVRFA